MSDTPDSVRLRRPTRSPRRTRSARSARLLVDSVWKGVVPGNSAGSILTTVGLSVAFAFLYFAALVSLLAGLIARRGLLMRGFQVEVVTRSGAPAGRLRLLARSIITWSVALVPCMICFAATSLSIANLATVIVAAGALAIVIWAVALAYNVKHPGRGVAERLSRTTWYPSNRRRSRTSYWRFRIHTCIFRPCPPPPNP